MAEKNTHSILETIKNKLHKLDQKTSNLSEVASEFEYITTTKPGAKPAQEEGVKNEEAAVEETSNSVDNKAEENLHDEIENQSLPQEVVEDISTENELPDETALQQENVAPPQIQENQQQVSSEVADFGIDEEDIENYEDEVDFAEESDDQIHSLEDDLLDEDLNLENNSAAVLAEDDLEIPNLEVSSSPELPENELEFADDRDIEDELGLNEKSLEALPQISQEAPEELHHEEAPETQSSTPEQEKNIPSQNSNMSHENDYDSELEALERELEEQEKKRKEGEVEKQQTVVSTKETPAPIQAAKEEEDIELEIEKELIGFNPQNIAPKQQIKPAAELKQDQEIKVEKPVDLPQQAEVLEKTPIQTPQEELLDNDILENFDDELEQQALPEVVKMESASQKRAKQILNEETIMQATDSIRKLVDAKNVVSGISNFAQSPALKDLATNMLEPRLERWLNENLAPMVEEIVREEIKKILPKE